MEPIIIVGAIATPEVAASGSKQLKGWSIGNGGSSIAWFKLFDAEAAEDITEDSVPLLVLPIPALSGNNMMLGDNHVVFEHGIVVRATAEPAFGDDTDPDSVLASESSASTSEALSGIVANLFVD